MRTMLIEHKTTIVIHNPWLIAFESTFSSMYRELCTARGQEPYTLTAFVMQASTAFQEKLDSLLL